MPDRERKRLLVTLAIFGVLLAVGLAYSPAQKARYVGDDHVIVSQDAKWRTASFRSLFTGLYWPDNVQSEVRTAYFRPVTLATLRLDNAVGDSPVEYHFTNVALHVTACALLAVLAMRLGASGISAAAAALAWGLAPRLTEAVAWVAGRSDVLAGTLSLAALASAPDIGRPLSRRRAWIASFASGALLLAAVLAKETALAAGAAIGVSALVTRAGDSRIERLRRLARLVPSLVLPAVVYVALRVPTLRGAAVHHRELDGATRLLTAFEALGRYAVLALDALRPRASIGMLGEIAWPFVVVGALVAVGVALAARRLARDVGVATSATLAAVALVPVLQIVPLSLAGGVVADRYLYLPLAGVVLAITVAARHLRERTARFATAAALALAIPFAIVTRDRATAYTDEVRFLVEAAEGAHPHNTAPRTALAGLVLEWGPLPLACSLYDRSRAVQEESGYAGTTRHRRTRENLGVCLQRLGKDAEARAIFLDVLRAAPTSARAYDGLALVDLHTFRFEEAAAGAERAIDLEPSLTVLVRRQFGHASDAESEAPSFATPEARAADPVGYARLLRHMNRNPEAVAAWLAIARDPARTPEEHAEALVDLIEHGPPPDVVPVASAGSSLAPRFAAHLRLRLRRWEQVERLRPRIEAIADR